MIIISLPNESLFMSNRFILLMTVVLISSLQGNRVEASSEKIQAYFNNNPNKSYQDPYRDITKRGDDLEKILIEAVESAESSILLAVQEFRLPNLAKALIKKKQEGVSVKVIVENQYNKDVLTMGQSTENNNSGREEEEEEEHGATKYYDLFAFIDSNFDGEISQAEMADRDAIYMLNGAEIEIKDDTFDRSYGSGLMHHKFVVIDGERLVVSSANFTLSGVHGDFLNDSSTGNSNALITIESAEVAQLFHDEFYIMWGGENNEKLGSRFGVGKPYRPSQRIAVGDSFITIQFSPTSKNQNWPMSVNGLIGRTLETAEQTIDMALFVYSDQKISEVLRKQILKKKDLKLSVLVEPKFAYRSYSELLDLWGLKLLDEYCKYEADNRPWRKSRRVQGGVPFLNRGDILHHKFAVVDSEKVIFGSQNWSDSANFINDEYVVVIENKNVALAFQDEFNQIMSSSRMGPTRNLLTKIQDKEDSCLNR